LLVLEEGYEDGWGRLIYFFGGRGFCPFGFFFGGFRGTNRVCGFFVVWVVAGLGVGFCLLWFFSPISVFFVVRGGFFLGFFDCFFVGLGGKRLVGGVLFCLLGGVWFFLGVRVFGCFFCEGVGEGEGGGARVFLGGVGFYGLSPHPKKTTKNTK